MRWMNDGWFHLPLVVAIHYDNKRMNESVYHVGGYRQYPSILCTEGALWWLSWLLTPHAPSIYEYLLVHERVVISFHKPKELAVLYSNVISPTVQYNWNLNVTFVWKQCRKYVAVGKCMHITYWLCMWWLMRGRSVMSEDDSDGEWLRWAMKMAAMADE